MKLLKIEVRCLLAVLLVLAGCQSPKWNKAGATEDDFRRDRGQCIAQAFAAPTTYQQNMIFNGCMQGKGWQLLAEEIATRPEPNNRPDTLHFSGDEAERISRTRNSFDPEYKAAFENCMYNNDASRRR